MKSFLFLAAILLTTAAHAAQVQKLQLDTSSMKIQTLSEGRSSFVRVKIPMWESDRTVGSPELPMKSWLVVGTPEQIQVQERILNTQKIAGVPYPTQEQDCRCETDKVRTFQLNEMSYKSRQPKVHVEYLGAFRGQPISRVDFRMADYNSSKKEITLATNAEVEISAPLFEMRDQEFKDYLILAPANLVEGVQAFADYKRSRGYNVFVETIAAPSNDKTVIQNLIKKYYTENGVDFVIFVGDENGLPMFRVRTSGSSQTPSDLPYLLMDGSNDNIPDVFASRIAVSTPDQVAAQLSKSIEYEQSSYENNSGFNRFIGIASNEGSSPSDDEYVRSIENKWKESAQSEIVHLYQNDANLSNPKFLSDTLNGGSFWLTYLGHGSGTSWPSMYRSYSVSDIKKLQNKPAVKPILIDVACMNGKLVSNYLGTTFMRAEGASFGAAAYFGGTVNISWHPPAVMARGIAFEQTEKKFKHLGQALLAGQLYLAANWNNQSEIVDNLEWYHLQGDPGMELKH